MKQKGGDNHRIRSRITVRWENIPVDPVIQQGLIDLPNSVVIVQIVGVLGHDEGTAYVRIMNGHPRRSESGGF